MSARAPRLLLVGGGHANIAVLKAAGRWTRQGVAVTLVDGSPYLLYSGMTPEYLGGRHPRQALRLDLRGWCRANGVRFVLSPAARLDVGARVVYTEDGAALPCDLAAFNLGGTNPWRERAGGAVLTKPLHHTERLAAWLEEVLARVQPRRSLVIVGGGPAGTEVMLNVSARALRSARSEALRLTLIQPEARLLPQFAPGMGRRAERLLRERGVAVWLQRKVARVETAETGAKTSTVVLEDGERLPADLVLWATGTAGQPLFREAGLPVSDGGYLRVGRDLRCPAAPWLLAAGDCAEVAGLTLDRSGVNAVKEGLTLRRNLDRLLRAWGEDPRRVRLERFRPYPVSPYLVSTGGPEALLSLGPRVWARGHALLWLKHQVDRWWVGRYDLPSRGPPD